MVLYATFNNISVITWRSDLLVKGNRSGLWCLTLVKLVFVVSLLSRYHLESELILAASVM
jgi:hypothetical protein